MNCDLWRHDAYPSESSCTAHMRQLTYDGCVLAGAQAMKVQKLLLLSHPSSAWVAFGQRLRRLAKERGGL